MTLGVMSLVYLWCCRAAKPHEAQKGNDAYGIAPRKKKNTDVGTLRGRAFRRPHRERRPGPRVLARAMKKSRVLRVTSCTIW
ncbi:hypothetical protein LZ30DRAFT_723494 [Colletotrichum cereale]|nr:hypothetical protein LZ30DRAFT_723494 [Colletotrichum cereale]